MYEYTIMLDSDLQRKLSLLCQSAIKVYHTRLHKFSIILRINLNESKKTREPNTEAVGAISMLRSARAEIGRSKKMKKKHTSKNFAAENSDAGKRFRGLRTKLRRETR